MGNICVIECLSQKKLCQNEKVYKHCIPLLSKCFFRWIIYYKNRRVEQLEKDMELNHRRSAELHQQIADSQEVIYHLENKVNKINKSCIESMTSQDHRVCCICFEQVHEYMKCEDGHVHCKSCINKRCRSIFKSYMDISDFPCLSTTNCDKRIQLSSLVDCEFGNLLYKEQVHMNSMKLVCDIIHKENSENKALKLKYLRHDGSYKAHACPKCGYGPIEHFHCDDLKEFHKSDNDNDNSCPSCTFFAEDISLYSEWDGNEPAVLST